MAILQHLVANLAGFLVIGGSQIHLIVASGAIILGTAGVATYVALLAGIAFAAVELAHEAFLALDFYG